MMGLFILLLMSFSITAAAAPTPPARMSALEQELKKLDLPQSEMPVGIDSEQLYAVQMRANPLRFKNEITTAYGITLNPSPFLSSRQFDLGYRFHFSDRWSLGAEGSYVTNNYSEAGEKYLLISGLVPDVAYVKYRGDVTLGFNLFYGKIRLTSDRVVYFDQYINIGPGFVQTNISRETSFVATAGLAFWLSKRLSIRTDVKNTIFKEKRVLGNDIVNHAVFQMSLGILLGGKT